MNTLKKILTAIVMTAMTSTAFAVANPSYEDVRSTIDNTLAKVEEAKSAGQWSKQRSGYRPGYRCPPIAKRYCQ